MDNLYIQVEDIWLFLLTGNRIIIYGFLENNDIKSIDYNEDESTYKKNDTNYLIYSKLDPIKEEYNFEHKDLITTIFYTDDKKIMFVSYKYKTLEIYNNETKELIKTIEKIKEEPNSFICKTEDNEYIIKGVEGGFILNKDFDPIAYVPGLENYKDGKLILMDWNEYFEVKKYSAKELIEKAREYLK